MISGGGRAKRSATPLPARQPFVSQKPQGVWGFAFTARPVYFGCYISLSYFSFVTAQKPCAANPTEKPNA